MEGQESMAMAEGNAITELDKKIVRALQGEFPLVAEPYKELADRIGIPEEVFLARVQAMEEQKKIRKMGAVLRHREVGYSANVLVAWVVPSERMDEIAGQMSSCPSVSHCYDRITAPGWPYNVYTMIHGKSRENCVKAVEELSRSLELAEYAVLFSRKELKKTSMAYF